MGSYGNKPWFQKQLQPMVKLLGDVNPDVLTWSAVGLSIVAGGLLYNSYERPWMAVAAVPLLMGRLALNSVDGILAAQKGSSRPSSEVLKSLSNRLSDVAIFLSLAFWPDIKVHLVLLAIIAVLIVSYVGVLGRAVTGKPVDGGVLAKADRMVLLMVTCLVYGLVPNATFAGFSVFECMFALFIPLASITLLQRLNHIFNNLPGTD